MSRTIAFNLLWRWTFVVAFKWFGWNPRWSDEQKGVVYLLLALVFLPLYLVSALLWFLTGTGPMKFTQRVVVVVPRVPDGAFWLRDPFGGRGRPAPQPTMWQMFKGARTIVPPLRSRDVEVGS